MKFQWIHGLQRRLQLLQSRRATRRTSRRMSWSPAEVLEVRSYPAAALIATFNDGVLRIEGTDKADIIKVSQKNQQISVIGITIQVDGPEPTVDQRVARVPH